jgi:hypothetical protein
MISVKAMSRPLSNLCHLEKSLASRSMVVIFILEPDSKKDQLFQVAASRRSRSQPGERVAI